MVQTADEMIDSDKVLNFNPVHQEFGIQTHLSLPSLACQVIDWQNLVHTSQALYCASYFITNSLYFVFFLYFVFPLEVAVSLAPCQIAIWQNLFALF